MNLRVSVTAIDSWLYFMRHEDADIGELMAQLRGETVQTEPMRVGSAFHKAMELAQPGTAMSLKANGYQFTVMPQVELVLPAFRELKLEAEIPISQGLTVTLVGKVDGLEGRTVTDHKTTKRYEPEYLLDTYQWKQYLVMAEADTFVWNVFIIDEGRWTEGGWEYQVKDVQRLTQYRYPGIESDCSDTLREFLAFLDAERMQFPTEQCTLANLLRANRYEHSRQD